MYTEINNLFYRKPVPPCVDCSDRNAICHSICEKYADWQKAGKAINDKITTAKTAEAMSREVIIKKYRKKRGF